MPIKPYAQEITYEHYCAAVAALEKDEPEQALYLPPELKVFMVELKRLMTTLALDSGVRLQDLVAALQNRDLFILLQAAGWSIKKVTNKLKAILQPQKYA